MPPQLIIIHGGHAFDPKADFLARLGERAVTAEDFKPRADWKSRLASDLGGAYEVFAPRMPNTWTHQVQRVEGLFEKMVPFLGDGLVLIGHSHAAIFSLGRLLRSIYAAPYHAVIAVPKLT